MKEVSVTKYILGRGHTKEDLLLQRKMELWPNNNEISILK